MDIDIGKSHAFGSGWRHLFTAKQSGAVHATASTGKSSSLLPGTGQ
jgi:hypothetical protein